MQLIGLCKSNDDDDHRCTLFCFSRDRIRTSVNILGDGIGAGVVDHLVRNELGPIDLEEGDNINAPITARTASELSAERRLHSRDDFHQMSKL